MVAVVSGSGGGRLTAKMYADTSTEVLALAVVVMIAAPSILLMMCILEECPVSPKSSLEDTPIFCGMFSTADIFGNAAASLMCFFFVVIALFGFAGMAGGWYMVARGSVAAEGDMDLGFAFLQSHQHGLSHFGSGAHDGVASSSWARHASLLQEPHRGAPKVAGPIDPDIAELLEGQGEVVAVASQPVATVSHTAVRGPAGKGGGPQKKRAARSLDSDSAPPRRLHVAAGGA